MAHLREKDGNYYAEFYDPNRSPTRKWRTLRCNDKQVARQRLAKLERKEARGEFDPWKENTPHEGLTISQAVEKFLRYRREVRGVREKTIRNYQYTLESFADSISVSLNVEYVDGDQIRGFLDRDDLSQTSRDTYYRQLDTFFGWCKSESIVEDNPMENVTRPGVPEHPAEYLTPDQLEHLLDTIRNDAEENSPQVGEGEVLWIIDVIKFAAYTGLRRGEICDLRWGAVDLENGFLTVEGTDDFNTKTGKSARIPLVEEVETLLRRKESERTRSNPRDHVFTGANSGSLYPDYLSHRFRHYRKMADLPDDISFHSLRHTCASMLVMGGVPLHTVKEMLRHSTIEVTKRYAHLAPEIFKDQIQKGISTSLGEIDD
ncbi:tyrosine-type recombinase/integrase [Salinibacter ruber]|uniref:tyrosine-type recombinase/integrase n=1 Tax=Salinibacter ruber TaxID=146919 RepID=UPI0020742DF3|nr:site-specific integrase [Salinibacter ruber]